MPFPHIAWKLCGNRNCAEECDRYINADYFFKVLKSVGRLCHQAFGIERRVISRKKSIVIGLPLTFAACVGYWLQPIHQAPFPTECMVNQVAVAPKPFSLRGNSPTSDVLYERTRSITVRVKAGRSGGSGILIQRQGQTYTVLTNRHVVSVGAPYVIQTPDGRSHPASLVKKFDFRGNDLATLQFRSKANYAIAPLTSTHHLLAGDPVVSAGFPLESPPKRANGLLITVGKISLLPQKAFVGGYQIGYTNLIQQGMSGGPVLNLRGEVIGVNSLHAYPLWGDPYIFQDGSKPPQAQRKTIIQSSWAVPIETFQAGMRR
ncbi:MAG: trypsin-like peptidase domain-containing protein [Oscillatoriales cyanobacterium C42_A2020_001]|nr:trypsin-like peptidase domain-containing protein [Leptolyngbyaceae cyanobacterium C42_A2020_001]